MPLIGTEGAASAQGFGMFSARPAANFIEDVFSTWLYTGNGSTQTINNGINLAPGATSSGWFSLVNLNGSSVGYGNAVDALGNIYISTSNSMQVLKYNSSGQLLWQRGLSGGDSNITRIALDSSANVYVSSSTTFSANWRIVKYDTNGTLLWQRAYTSSLSFDTAYSIATDSTNSVYVCGSTDIGAGGGLTLIKYDTNGTLQWQRQLKNFTTDGLGVAVDSGDNPLVCGSANGLAVVAKYNSSGTLQWQQTIASGRFNAVTFDASSNVYVVGSNNTAAFIAKYNSSGTIQWQRSLSNPSSGGASFNSIAVDSSGNSFVCGRTGSPQNGILLARYDTNGTLQWQRSILSVTSSYTSGSSWSIKIDGSSNICFNANFQDQFFNVDLFFGKIPADGTGVGTYTLGSGSFSYASSSFTPATSTNTAATGTLAGSTPSFTSSTTSLTNATTTLASSLANLNEVSSNGLVWMKGRSGATDHALYDTARGATFDLASNLASAQTTQSTGLTGFLANGFSIGSLAKINTNAATYTSWTFREQPRFFDIVTYTGNGANRTIAHNLQSVPGCIMVKRTDTTGDWQVYHRSLANTQYMVLNSTAAAATGATRWNSTTPTATEFSLGTDATVNAIGGTYVAYLFAHDAGGFGATGADNVISCGTFMTDSNGNATVNLGYEPQWVLMKAPTPGNWLLFDNMRGMTTNSTPYLLADSTTAEITISLIAVQPTATGFDIKFGNSPSTLIYIAIRRGPMRTPTTGTSVFEASLVQIFSSGFWGTYTTNGRLNGVLGAPAASLNAIDWSLLKLSSGVEDWLGTTRLTGFSSTNTAISTSLSTNTPVLESVKAGGVRGNAAAASTGLEARPISTASPVTFPIYSFARAPGFFDVVCWTGDATGQPRNHNLGVVPELVIQKPRSSSGNWNVWRPSVPNRYLILNSSAAEDASGGLTATSTTFNIIIDQVNVTYITYLFASAPGVSRVGTYTGTGATQTINCGFAAGARFVLIKRTDLAGDWYVWDSTRGIVAANDPYLVLNSTAAEVTTTDWVDTAASGFELSNAAGNLVNTSGGSYIFLAIA